MLALNSRKGSSQAYIVSLSCMTSLGLCRHSWPEQPTPRVEAKTGCSHYQALKNIDDAHDAAVRGYCVWSERKKNVRVTTTEISRGFRASTV